MLSNPNQVVTLLNKLAPNVGLSHTDKKSMVDPMLFMLGMFVIDMTKFGDWMESKYPSYKEKSIQEFLMDKDPDHIEEWKELLGVFQ